MTANSDDFTRSEEVYFDDWFFLDVKKSIDTATLYLITRPHSQAILVSFEEAAPYLLKIHLAEHMIKFISIAFDEYDNFGFPQDFTDDFVEKLKQECY